MTRRVRNNLLVIGALAVFAGPFLSVGLAHAAVLLSDPSFYNSGSITDSGGHGSEFGVVIGEVVATTTISSVVFDSVIASSTIVPSASISVQGTSTSQNLGPVPVSTSTFTATFSTSTQFLPGMFVVLTGGTLNASGTGGWQYNGMTVNGTGKIVPVFLYNLAQYEPQGGGGAVIINEGSTTGQPQVLFSAYLGSSGTGTIQAQIEVEPSNVAFVGIPNVTSSFITPDNTNPYVPTSVVIATSSILQNGSYHWQERAVDSNNNTSTWHIFNTNGTGVDFIVAASSSPVQLSNLSQFKSDGMMPLGEGSTTMENTMVIEGTPSSSLNDSFELQVELSTSTGSFANPIFVTSTPVASGQTATATISNLPDGDYHWQAQLVDAATGATSSWQTESNPAASLDFAVHQVPLYTQNDPAWEFDTYAEGHGAFSNPNDPTDKACGPDILHCGCVITSITMIARYYGIATGTDGTPVTPYYLDAYLNSHHGYTPYGDLTDWSIPAKYANDASAGVKLQSPSIVYAGTPIGTLETDLDNDLASLKPAIIHIPGLGHFIVANDTLSNTYAIRDPDFYADRTLNDNVANSTTTHTWAYHNNFNSIHTYSAISLDTAMATDLTLSMSSPAEIVVTDPNGQKVGFDPVSSTTFSGIDGAVYYSEGIGDGTSLDPGDGHLTKYAWIPNPISGDYAVQVFGTGSGDYTLQEVYSDESSSEYSQIATGTISINQESDFSLNFSTSTPSSTVFTPSNPPSISSFSASSSEVLSGATSILSWSITNASSVAITPGSFSTSTLIGSTTVNPTSTTIYTLTATSPNGTSTATTTVTVDATPPSVPTSVVATATGTSTIALSWATSTDAGGPGLAGYRIFRCTGASCTPTSTIATTNATTTSFADSGLAASTAYTYAVSAYDTLGLSSATSTAVSTTTQAGSASSTPIAFVRAASSTYNGGGSSHLSASFSGTVATGDMVAVVVSYGDNNNNYYGGTTSDDDVIGCRDTNNATSSYREAVDSLNGNEYNGIDIWYATNVAGGTNPAVTCTLKESVDHIWMGIEEYSGVATSSALEAATFVNNSPSSASWNTGSVTTRSNGDLVLGGFEAAWANLTFTAGSGFTKRIDMGQSEGMMAEDQIQSSAGSIAATATSSAAISGQEAVVAAFRPASAALPSGIRWIQNASGHITNGVNPAATFMNPVATGDTIVVGASYGDGSEGITGCRDTYNATSSFHEAATISNNGSYASEDIWYATGVTGGANDTVICTVNTSIYNKLITVSEYAGVATSTPLDATSTYASSATSTLLTTGTSTTAHNGDLIFGMLTHLTDDNTAILAPGSGYTMRTTDSGTGSEDMIQSSAGAVSATAVNSESTQYLGALAAFRAQ